MRLSVYCGSGFAFLATIVDSTVVDNDASETPLRVDAGGVSRFGLNPPMVIRNTIVAGNIGTGLSPDVFGHFSTGGGNVIGNPDGGTGLLASAGDQLGTTSSPLLVDLEPLALNGGRLKTHRPAAGSVAIDGGVDVPGLTFDQRGVPHSTGARDAGAHERGEALEEGQGVEHERTGSVAAGAAEGPLDLAIAADLEAALGEWWTGEVAEESFEALRIAGLDAGELLGLELGGGEELGGR